MKYRSAVTALVALLASTAPAVAASVGFERIAVPDADGRPRPVAIWYPTDARPSAQPIGPYSHEVAVGAPMLGHGRPLVLILHGHGGSLENHFATALALTDAGFVAASIGHGPEMSLVARTRHVARVIDHLVGGWRHRSRLDPTQIGIYGFSIGAFTGLVTIGGTPDLTRVAPYCAQHADRVCAILRDRTFETSVPTSAWAHDTRIKAAVLAAPTLAFTFPPDDLALLTVPIQLWRPVDDDVTPHPRNAQVIYDALALKPEYVEVPHAGHFAFVACNAEVARRAPPVCRDAPEFDREAFHRAFHRAVVRFFTTRLAGR